jgi:hypothetical protein
MSALMVGIGVALLVRAIASGGGGAWLVALLGVLFIAAGAGRLYVSGRVGKH